MKEKIESVCDFFEYQIVEMWEDENYCYACIGDSIITYVMLKELIDKGLEFVIDSTDFKDGYPVIAFFKN